MPDADHNPASRSTAGAAPAVAVPSADAIAAAAGRASAKGLPPVHLWDPPFCGDLDIRIARDGTWFYLGTPIGRKPLVRLFSSILKREGDRHFLVTPVEKVGITVDDAPFVAVDFTRTGAGPAQRLHFVTQVDDEVTAGPGHAIRLQVDVATGAPAPYLHVRSGLEALIDRKSFYRLVDIADEHAGEVGVWSGGAFFAFMPAHELARLAGL